MILYLAEKTVTMDATDIIVAGVVGLFGLATTFVTAAFTTRRSVKSAVENTVNAHGDNEMEHLEAIEDELKIVHDELRMMRTALTASTELAATLASTQDRRMSLLEQRVLRIEHV